MKLRSIAAASLLALASASSFAVNLGTLDLSSGSNSFGNTPIAGSFVDTISFTIVASVFNAGIITVVNGTQNVDFTSIVLTGPAGTFSVPKLTSDPVEVWATPAAGYTLTAGTYTLTLTGTNSASIGSYSANLAVTPVPEPETYAMLLAGLGIVGLSMRRRRD